MATAPVISALDLSETWTGILSVLVVFVIPDLALMAAVAIWGKPGFQYVKAKVFGFLKLGLPPDRVGPVRHAIGLTMFVLPIAFAWLSPYLSEVTGESLGRMPYAVIGDVVFLTSFFVLGGDFWDKFRSLFVREAVAQFPRPSQAA
jgi:hypothetical protein